jgi:hypothetical protein
MKKKHNEFPVRNKQANDNFIRLRISLVSYARARQVQAVHAHAVHDLAERVLVMHATIMHVHAEYAHAVLRKFYL